MNIIKCIKCKTEKPESEYRLWHGKRNKTCIVCRERNNLWYAQDLDGRKTKAKEAYQKKRTEIARYRSDHRLQVKYSLTREIWHSMLEKQNNRCGICEVSFGEKYPCVDHDHNTGRVRGLLCRKCNLDLQAIENEDFAKKAVIYLKKVK